MGGGMCLASSLLCWHGPCMFSGRPMRNEVLACGVRNGHCIVSCSAVLLLGIHFLFCTAAESLKPQRPARLNAASHMSQITVIMTTCYVNVSLMQQAAVLEHQDLVGSPPTSLLCWIFSLYQNFSFFYWPLWNTILFSCVHVRLWGEGRSLRERLLLD